jgi:recombination protein RecR
LYGKTIDQLIDALRILPGVGVKSAQRMALQLLEKDRAAALKLSEAIEEAATKVGNCVQCRTLTEHDLCDICNNPSRSDAQLSTRGAIEENTLFCMVIYRQLMG